jgi:polyribonucleotide nucleotidyltransferase
MSHRVQLEWGGRLLVLETGVLARQAGGAVLARYADTVVLAAATASPEPKQGVDFLPLTVNYQERTYAAGKIPGGFFKREGRPSEKETLTSRLIDRPMRPLFPEGYRNETQVIVNVISADGANDPDILALVAASAALAVSDIPLAHLVGAVRVGMVEGRFVMNPTYAELAQSRMNLVVAGTAEAVTMVEGEAKEVSEEEMLEALDFARSAIAQVLSLQETLRAAAGKEKREHRAPIHDEKLVSALSSFCRAEIAEALHVADKQARNTRLQEIRDQAVAEFGHPEEGGPAAEAGVVDGLLHDLEGELMREMVLAEGVRIDGRKSGQIRPISSLVGLLPRVHGSAVFTRGETQALVAVTLGTTEDEQIIDALEGDFRRKFMLHYNFPPFCTGEVKFMRAPSRREIGHGKLAERAHFAVLPDVERFPYTIRVVSDVLESNGSSSMATICGTSLSLMDAGVPISAPVAGIAMGLVHTPARSVVLSDILGAEDHLGDMDFKVAGTRKGITAFQMDLKITGVSRVVMAQALEQARQGRLHILDKMAEALAAPRPDISPYAPRIVTIKIKPDKIREIIGPGGKMIRSIVERTGAKIEVEDDGTVLIASPDEKACQMALTIIKGIVEEPEVGRIYQGTVRSIQKFGAFVEIIPGTDGLVHVSQLADRRVEKVEDVVALGQVIPVKILDIDPDGKIKLSLKEALRELGEKTGGNPSGKIGA